MRNVSIYGQHHRPAFLYNPGASVSPSGDAPLMTLWLLEPTLLFQIVSRYIKIIPAGKQPYLESLHDSCHVLGDFICCLLKPPAQCLEYCFPLFTAAGIRIKALLHLPYLFCLPANLLKLPCYSLKASVDTFGQPFDELMSRCVCVLIDNDLQRFANPLQPIEHPQPSRVCGAALVVIQDASDYATVVQYYLLGGGGSFFSPQPPVQQSRALRSAVHLLYCVA